MPTMIEAPAIKLMIMSGPDDGTILALDSPKHGDAYIIGRREDCDVILPYDSQISRQHASLSIKNGTWYVEDLHSRNGTYVDKQKIETPTPVKNGEMFRVGRTWLRLKHRGPKE